MKLSAILSALVLSASAFFAHQAVAQEGEDIFDHNGSIIVSQYRYGNLRYLQVKPSLQGLVDQGMAAFSGQIERRGKADGTAYVFKKGCPFIPYEVKGAYDPSIPGYVLTGAYPVREKNGCKVIGHSTKGKNARLVFVDMVEKNQRAAKSSKASEDAYIKQIYETESDPNWMNGFISSEELERRNRKDRK
jgi:hypothetical protein